MKKIIALLLCILFILPTATLVFADDEITPEHDCEVDGHEFGEWEVETEPTCETEGTKFRVCIYCLMTEYDSIPNANIPHKFGDWEVIEEPTYTTDGLEVRICDTCFFEENRPIAKKAFSDVKQDKWYTDAILFCADKGYMVGTSATKFSLSGQITRAMMVTIMANIAGADTSVYQTSSFKDVKITSWYGPAVEWAVENGLTAGTGEGVFSPNKYATREEVCVFLNNLSIFMGKPLAKWQSASNFNDYNQIHQWALESVELCNGEGIITGMTSKYLCPRIYTTRASMAVMLTSFDKVKNLIIS